MKKKDECCNMTAEEKATFRKEWKKACDRLKRSGYDLSKIEITTK